MSSVDILVSATVVMVGNEFVLPCSILGEIVIMSVVDVLVSASLAMVVVDSMTPISLPGEEVIIFSELNLSGGKRSICIRPRVI